MRSQSLPPPETHQKGSDGLYWGPFEEARPGHRLHWSRLEEYEAFIRTKGVVPKRWGFYETWIDSGARPFKLYEKPKDEDIEDINEINPFQENQSPSSS